MTEDAPAAPRIAAADLTCFIAAAYRAVVLTLSQSSVRSQWDWTQRRRKGGRREGLRKDLSRLNNGG